MNIEKYLHADLTLFPTEWYMWLRNNWNQQLKPINATGYIFMHGVIWLFAIPQ